MFVGSLTSPNLYSGNAPRQKNCFPIQRFMEGNQSSGKWSADMAFHNDAGPDFLREG